MSYIIRSGKPITEEQYKMIRDILKYSQCPNESLKNSVKGFSYFDGKIVQLEAGEAFIFCIKI